MRKGVSPPPPDDELSSTDELTAQIKLTPSPFSPSLPTIYSEVPPTFHPEFGRYMLESTPGAPYDVSIKSLLSVEPNMRLRYALPSSVLWLRQPTRTTADSYPLAACCLCPPQSPNRAIVPGRQRAPHDVHLLASPRSDGRAVRGPTLPHQGRSDAVPVRRRRGHQRAHSIPVSPTLRRVPPTADLTPDILAPNLTNPSATAVPSPPTSGPVAAARSPSMSPSSTTPTPLDRSSILPSLTIATSTPATAKPRTGPHCPTTSTWTPWRSAWDAAVCRSPSRHQTFRRRRVCTTHSCRSHPSWSVFAFLAGYDSLGRRALTFYPRSITARHVRCLACVSRLPG